MNWIGWPLLQAHFARCSHLSRCENALHLEGVPSTRLLSHNKSALLSLLAYNTAPRPLRYWPVGFSRGVDIMILWDETLRPLCLDPCLSSWSWSICIRLLLAHFFTISLCHCQQRLLQDLEHLHQYYTFQRKDNVQCGFFFFLKLCFVPYFLNKFLAKVHGSILTTSSLSQGVSQLTLSQRNDNNCAFNDVPGWVHVW